LAGLQWEARVQACYGVLKPLLEHDLIVALPLWSLAFGNSSIGADVLLTFDVVIKCAELIQQRLLHGGLR
jgi:hypothetical protein